MSLGRFPSQVLTALCPVDPTRDTLASLPFLGRHRFRACGVCSRPRDSRSLFIQLAPCLATCLKRDPTPTVLFALHFFSPRRTTLQNLRVHIGTDTCIKESIYLCIVWVSGEARSSIWCFSPVCPQPLEECWQVGVELGGRLLNNDSVWVCQWTLGINPIC